MPAIVLYREHMTPAVVNAKDSTFRSTSEAPRVPLTTFDTQPLASSYATMGTSAVMTVVNVLTTVVSICVALSPLPDYYRMYQHKSTGDMSILPVVALFANCYAWTVYGYIVGNIFPLFSVCLFGCVIAIAYSIVFYLLSEDRQHVCRLWVYVTAFSVVVAVYAGIGIAGVTDQPRNQVEKILGFVATAVNICLFASPLATMRHVVITKDASSMPITMSAVALLSGSLWVVVGIDDSDFFVTGSNGIGVVLSVAQIVLYWTFRPSKATEETAKRSEGTTTEVGIEEGGNYTKTLPTP